MEILSSLGSTGLGLVWGWLVGGFRTPMAHPVRTTLILTTATLAPALLIFRLAGFVPMLLFFAAVGAAAVSRYSWHRRLTERLGPPHN